MNRFSFGFGARSKYRYVFTAIEDQVLEAHIKKFGTTSWELIARALPGRAPRQCRERWFTYLSPDVNRSPWSAEEDGLLFDLMQVHGQKWGIIVEWFCNRTQNNIKNRWNTVRRKAGVLGLDSGNRNGFIETGQRITSRSTRRTFEPPTKYPPPKLPSIFSLENLLNAK
jgi:hypothetical protein